MPVAPVVDNFYTTVRNVSGKTLPFSFLPRGKALANNAEVTFLGSIDQHLTNRRKRTSFENAIKNSLIIVTAGPAEAQVILCAVDNTTVLAKGDMVWLDTDDVKGAAVFTWNTDLATTQNDFANKFLGIALAAHANGGGAITNFPVDISEEAVWSIPCTSQAHEVGQTLGPAKDTGNALLSQKLENAVAASSIARAAKRDASATTTVKVRLRSAHRGTNAAGAQ